MFACPYCKSKKGLRVTETSSTTYAINPDGSLREIYSGWDDNAPIFECFDCDAVLDDRFNVDFLAKKVEAIKQ
jgi:hypothetical protein